MTMTTTTALIRTLIVDDEVLARQNVEALLGLAHCRVIGEDDDGELEPF